LATGDAKGCLTIFLQTFSGSRRKVYYIMSIHEHLPPQARKDLKEVGWTEELELAKVARRDGQHFDCATWLHKAREMPKDDFRREVEKELTGREEEPSELIYFKVYKGSTHWKQELVPIRRTRELQFCAIIAKFIILTRGILRLFNRNSGKYLSERITLFLPLPMGSLIFQT
jgi:hypothetical protein